MTDKSLEQKSMDAFNKSFMEIKSKLNKYQGYDFNFADIFILAGHSPDLLEKYIKKAKIKEKDEKSFIFKLFKEHESFLLTLERYPKLKEICQNNPNYEEDLLQSILMLTKNLKNHGTFTFIVENTMKGVFHYREGHPVNEVLGLSFIRMNEDKFNGDIEDFVENSSIHVYRFILKKCLNYESKGFLDLTQKRTEIFSNLLIEINQKAGDLKFNDEDLFSLVIAKFETIQTDDTIVRAPVIKGMLPFLENIDVDKINKLLERPDVKEDFVHEVKNSPLYKKKLLEGTAEKSLPENILSEQKNSKPPTPRL